MTSIIAVLTDPATARTCLDAATAAAAAVPTGKIEAFHARLRPESLILPTEEVMTNKRRASLVAKLDEKSEVLRYIVRSWVADNATATAPVWQEIEGDTVEAIVAARGKTADLVVLVRPGNPGGKDALHAAIFETGRLLLLVPPSPAAPPLRFGRHMAIAWKASSHAERAVTAAVPWLKQAKRVSLLLVGEDVAPAGAAAAALALLDPYGIKAEPVIVARANESVGARLLHEAHAVDADCLVMGAYRHNRLLEMIVGGVTHHMLQAADLPLYLMH